MLHYQYHLGGVLLHAMRAITTKQRRWRINWWRTFQRSPSRPLARATIQSDARVARGKMRVALDRPQSTKPSIFQLKRVLSDWRHSKTRQHAVQSVAAAHWQIRPCRGLKSKVTTRGLRSGRKRHSSKYSTLSFRMRYKCIIGLLIIQTEPTAEELRQWSWLGGNRNRDDLVQIHSF